MGALQGGFDWRPALILLLVPRRVRTAHVAHGTPRVPGASLCSSFISNCDSVWSAGAPRVPGRSLADCKYHRDASRPRPEVWAPRWAVAVGAPYWSCHSYPVGCVSAIVNGDPAGSGGAPLVPEFMLADFYNRLAASK